MQKLTVLFFKALKRIKSIILGPLDFVIGFFILYSNGIKFGSFENNGIPLVSMSLGGICVLGDNFKMNNREIANPIGRFCRCTIIIGRSGRLIIGKNVGMSSSTIVCHKNIVIGDNVKLGGNVVIYDTDFHNLNSKFRLNSHDDLANTKSVAIGNNVFIGAHATILKGVIIGNNAIVGACSVVTKDIPSNEIWAGNPAKFVKYVPK